LPETQSLFSCETRLLVRIRSYMHIYILMTYIHISA
jgi:hypothetical protein